MGKARRRKPPAGRPAAEGGNRREHWRADGRPKTRFETADDANRSALQLRLESGADLHPYPCGWCNGWHLGNRVPGTSPPETRP